MFNACTSALNTVESTIAPIERSCDSEKWYYKQYKIISTVIILGKTP